MSMIHGIPKEAMDGAVQEVAKVMTSGEFDFSDEEIDKRLVEGLVGKCNFSEKLSKVIVLRSRDWILATTLAKKYFPIHYGKKDLPEIQEEVADFMFHDKARPEFSRELAIAAILFVKDEVHLQVFKNMEKFARLNIVDASNMHDDPVEVATSAIKKFNLNYRTNFLHKMFTKAIANQQAIVREKDRKARKAKKKLAEIKAGQEKIRKSREQTAQLNAESSAKDALKKEQARQKEIQRKEILARQRVPLWKTSGARLPDAYPVGSEEEAYKLDDMTLVVLNDVVYNVRKHPKSGKVSLRELNFEIAFSRPRIEKSNDDVPTVDIAKLNTIWVVCPNIASEAVKAISLLKSQMTNQEVISKLPNGSLVVQDMVAINNINLHEVQGGKLVKIAPCRKATRKERNTSSEYLEQKRASN